MNTRLRVYSVIYDPTSRREVKGERACLRLKIEDSLSARSYWTEPLLPSELAKILGAEHDREPEATHAEVSVATAILTSAAFNFKTDKQAGEPIVPKRPIADLKNLGTPGVKWIGDVRVRKIEPTRAALKALGVKADKHGPLVKERSKERSDSATQKKQTQEAADALWEELGLSPIVKQATTELIKSDKARAARKETVK